MSKSTGKAWPYGIALSFVGIIGLIIATIIVASKNSVVPSDLYMQNYHEVDANANELIYNKIAFDKKYTIDYVGEQLNVKGATVAFKITDKSGIPVKNATIDAVVTRPNSVEFDVALNNPAVSETGEYSFTSVELPKEGRWNIMAKISVGDDQRYFNLKADTRYAETFEF